MQPTAPPPPPTSSRTVLLAVTVDGDVVIVSPPKGPPYVLHSLGQLRATVSDPTQPVHTVEAGGGATFGSVVRDIVSGLRALDKGTDTP